MRVCCAQCAVADDAAATFDKVAQEWVGQPCWLVVADALVQRPGLSNPSTLRRIQHSATSARIVPRRRIVHPDEVNCVR